MIDISPPVDAAAAVFPGDTPFSQKWVATIGPGCPVNVSAVSLSPHVGAHADAPLHYDPQGASVGELPLAPFIGPCRVIHCFRANGGLSIQDLDAAWPEPRNESRLLIRTQERWQRQWQDQFASITGQALQWLADQGIQLVGIDTASVDPADSKTLDAHQVLRQRDLRVLENLCLDHVAPGVYELIALPMRWMGTDASPVRAILRPLESQRTC